jgi:phospho-N-acetylmuramoyl-pentapeptide-transferase
MFYWLTELSDKISFFNVFRYITFRTGGRSSPRSSLSSCSAADHRRPAPQAGQRTADPQRRSAVSPRHQEGHADHGGLMILSGLLVSTLLWANPRSPYVWVVLGVTLSFGIIGFYDDYLKVTKQTDAGVSVRNRLIVEAVIAVLACTAMMHLGRGAISTSLVFPFFKDLVINLGWAFVILGAFVVVASGNAVNLTDDWTVSRSCRS